MGKLALAKGLRYQVFLNESIYGVRMYSTFPDFVRGWRRNFRAGMLYTNYVAPLEITLIIGTLLGCGNWPATTYSVVTALLAYTLMLLMIRRYVGIGLLTFVGVPVALCMFCYISILAAFDVLCKRPMR